jgi:hypothetical protein
MSSKKVVLFSTRKIQDEGIFKSFVRQKPSNSLLKYFRKVNSGAFEDVFKTKEQKEASLNSDEKLKEWKNELRRVRGAFSQEENNNIKKIVKYDDQLLNYVVGLVPKDDSIVSIIEKGKKIIEERERAKNEMKSAWKQDINYDLPWNTNIDAKGRTLGDRVSLFRFPDSQNEFAVYAVWPLTESCADKCEDNSWVKALTQAVLEMESDCNEIILWLHDNDLEETKQSTFHVIFYRQNVEMDNNKTICCSLGVFQHPDKEFINVLFTKSDKAKSIYNAVNTTFGKIQKMLECNTENRRAEVYSSKTPNESNGKKC